MPYTAPSPLTSAPRAESTISRPSSHGRHNSDPSLVSLGRGHNFLSSPSSSYIHRHRRSPSHHTSIPSHGRSGSQSQRTGSKRLGSDDTSSSQTSFYHSSSLGDNALIRRGTNLSPPDSRRSSSDDDEGTGKGKEEHILAELQAVIISIDQSSSRATSRSGIVGKEKYSAPTTESHQPRRKLVSKDTPKLTLPNSTDGMFRSSDIATHTPDDSEREDEMDLSKKPQMVRKKSGELVRPALRASKKRPVSLPGTPTFSKAVHFDSQLEHIRHFLQVDKPLAVSAETSPLENYDGDTEFPFEIGDPPSQSEAFEWEAQLVNFPADSDARRHQPVRLERIFLTSDCKNLVGAVAVANIAFHKHVVARFTLDNWKTTSEVAAEYDNEDRTHDGYDRFNFNIRLADQANLDTRTMFICIRYNVKGLEFWDNNWSRNYQVKFSKKRPKNENRHGSDVGSRAGHSLPRARASASSTPRPHSFPSAIVFDTPQQYIAPNELEITESPLQLSASPADDMVPDTPLRRNKPAPQAFTKRYDFEASLSAVMQSGSAGQTRHGLSSEKTGGGQFDSHSTHPPQPRPEGGRVAKQATKPSVGPSTGPLGIRTGFTGSSKPGDLVSDKPYHQSPVYKELVDKYCFYGSKTPAKWSPTTFHAIRDRYPNTVFANTGSSPSDSSLSSSQESSPIREHATPVRGINRNSTPPPAIQVSGSELRSLTSSPIAYPYPYHQAMQNTLLSESPTPTVIRG